VLTTLCDNVDVQETIVWSLMVHRAVKYVKQHCVQEDPEQVVVKVHIVGKIIHCTDRWVGLSQLGYHRVGESLQRRSHQ
jgi:hypothetical protein